jgi:hypothetical protein
MVTKNTQLALGVFATAKELEQAINELKAANFPLERVSVIGKDVEKGDRIDEVQMSDRIGSEKANTTSAIGDTLSATGWGSLLLGLGSLAIPSNLGAVLAVGTIGVAIASSLGGVAISAASTENLVKAIKNLGIPEERARVYSDRLQQSYYLLILDSTDEDIHRAEAILQKQDIQNWGIYDKNEV